MSRRTGRATPEVNPDPDAALILAAAPHAQVLFSDGASPEPPDEDGPALNMIR